MVDELMDKDSIDRCEEICDESFKLTSEQMGGVFSAIKENIAQYTLVELGCYLRCNYARAESIPNYHDLRLAAIEYCKSQDGDMSTFYGLIDYVPYKRMF